MQHVHLQQWTNSTENEQSRAMLASEEDTYMVLEPEGRRTKVKKNMAGLCFL